MSRKKAAVAADAPVTIKKYANRRLYNTASSCYVTLDDLCKMVKDETVFVVYDARTGEDLTRCVLTQIIVEEESKGKNLLPVSFLRQLIGFYGCDMQDVLPRYLECTLRTFSQSHGELRQTMLDSIGATRPGSLEALSKKNLAVFNRMIGVFQSFNGGAKKGAVGEHAEQAVGPNTTAFHDLQEQIDIVQRKLAEITKRSQG